MTTERRTLRLAHSEVCMHMRVAGTDMTAEHVGGYMVQLLNERGGHFSFPITEGEAGWGMVGNDHTLTDFDADGRWHPKPQRPQLSIVRNVA